MKRNSLGWWLAASNVVIVLLVAAGISYFAIDMLRDLADSQQKIRVQLAGANSRAGNHAHGRRHAHLRARAGRPSAAAAACSPSRAATASRRSCAASAKPASSMPARCSTARSWSRSSGAELPWPQTVHRGAAEQGERFMAVPPGTAVLR